MSLKPQTPVIPPWAASLLKGSSPATKSPSTASAPAGTAATPLTQTRSVNGSQSSGKPTAKGSTPTANQNAASEANSDAEDSGASSTGEEPEGSDAETSPAAPLLPSQHTPSDINPAPARIVSDIAQAAKDAAASQPLSAPPLRVQSEPKPGSQRSTKHPAVQKDKTEPTREADSKASRISSFAASSRMKALQSAWEQDSLPKPSFPVLDGALSPSSLRQGGQEANSFPNSTSGTSRARGWNAHNKRPLEDEGNHAGSKRRLVNGYTHQQSSTPSLGGGTQQLSEQDLVQAMQKNGSGHSSLRTSAELNHMIGADGAKASAGAGAGAGFAQPTVIPIGRKAQPPPSSSDEDEDYEDYDEDDLIGQDGAATEDGDSDDSVEDIEGSTFVTQVPAQANSAVNVDAVVPLTMSLNDIPYSKFRDSEGDWKTAPGLLLPTNYKLWDDPTYPYICPVRDCRKILPKLLSLGAHLLAKHNGGTFNDNADGTMSFVTAYKNEWGRSPPIIVSAIPIGPDAPEPAVPTPSGYVKKGVEEKQRMALLAGSSSSKFPSQRQVTRSNSGALMSSAGFTGSSNSSAETARNMGRNEELYRYLKRQLPPDFEIDEKGRVSELLQLVRRRDLPSGWMPARHPRFWNPSAITSLLMYLTGDPVEGQACDGCRADGSSWRCVMAPKQVDMSSSAANSACAACWFKSNYHRKRNTCSFLSSQEMVPRERQGVSRANRNGNDKDQSDMELDDVVDKVPSHPTPNYSHGQKRQRATGVTATSGRTVRTTTLASRTTQPEAVLERGNIMSADMLEMEDWEVAPGKIQRETGPTPENIAFSNSFLTSNHAIPVSDGVSFHVITLKPGATTRLGADLDKLRVCSLATGKVRVKMDGGDFAIGPNGMFKVKPGTACEVLNRLYVDAVLHISSIAEN